MRLNILSIIGNLYVIVSGDAQSNSPGHSAKYLTYLACCQKLLKIFFIYLECTDKQDVGGKSPNMEKEAFKHAIQQLKNLLNLKEVVTDASSSMIAMMGNYM